MLKFKLWHTVDCVVGGVYFRPGTRRAEYLLCGLYDADGLLHYVGRCGVDDPGADEKIRPLLGGEGFSGNAPGGPSRWSRRERVATPLRPELVIEVSADHITAGKFRHGSRLVRWREDKSPRSCTMDQLRHLVPQGAN
jgi:ATP-dependent DNA ligase